MNVYSNCTHAFKFISLSMHSVVWLMGIVILNVLYSMGLVHDYLVLWIQYTILTQQGLPHLGIIVYYYL